MNYVVVAGTAMTIAPVTPSVPSMAKVVPQLAILSRSVALSISVTNASLTLNAHLDVDAWQAPAETTATAPSTVEGAVAEAGAAAIVTPPAT